MKTLIGSVLALATAGTLAGCAQNPPTQHGMMMGSMPMMGNMPMMGGSHSPEAQKMMAMCMEHMQAMSGAREGTNPSR